MPRRTREGPYAKPTPEAVAAARAYFRLGPGEQLASPEDLSTWPAEVLAVAAARDPRARRPDGSFLFPDAAHGAAAK